jgi:1-acyl-sn-glycerol-3-phosphate acyltransferase
MWNAIVDGEMPKFWQPRPRRVWSVILEPFRRWYLARYYRISEVIVEGFEEHVAPLSPDDGILIAPNHSHDSDPHVLMEVGRRASRQLYFMAAWQIFRPHWGLDGWVLQRMGVFSVDREGCDRRAIQQANELLTSGRSLVVFPEGEVYRLNDRLTPLLEGVSFIALCAQRDLARAKPSARVWVVPTAIRYRYTDDVHSKLEATMDRLEERMLYKTPPGMPLDARILRFGEILLSIKEKEKLGQSCESAGDLRTRLAGLTTQLLEQHEMAYLKKTPAAETVPLRIKALRRHLRELWTNDANDSAVRRAARDALDDVQLALQAYSYPGDYISERPSLERMAETIEKYEEDIEGYARPKGARQARVVFGQPIDMSLANTGGRPRIVAAEVTDRLEDSIQALMRAG